ncbi:Palmitoyl-protein thioesterase 1 [Operophtera brumata]|uniref:Palmitoyl-protein thioesterase 1 n=1 Tax=Operophtera brumata TaxID=104452 RepID=A0A0L7LBD2_OPEBR|nr:Palmitoyl-protein thioesterase 1 [Operophtera brumata]
MKLCVFLFFIQTILAGPTPIVLWHGMGDTCCASFSLGSFKLFLEKTIPGVYVHSLRIGNSTVEDLENGYFMSPNKQIDYACNMLARDPLLKKGQHQGVYGLPHCGALQHRSCNYIRKLLNHAAYIKWVQESLVQATYWHDPLDEATYQTNSEFLSDVNNELAINQTYVDNLSTLHSLVLVKFNSDTMKMDKAGKLIFLSTDGDHLRMSDVWFIDNIVKPYLN